MLVNTVTCVRFPWQLDVGALSRNNGIVQHCCVSLDTQQYWMALASLAYNNVNKQHCYARNNKTHVSMVFRILLTSPVWFGDHSSTDVLVCRAMDSFWLED
jgi:hypothetical protein